MRIFKKNSDENKIIEFLFIAEKSGIEPTQLIDLYRHISEKCTNLSLEGLMTIGKFGHDYTIGPNPDFLCLLQCHANVCNTFNLSQENVQISMGMSDDFERAVSYLFIYFFQILFLHLYYLNETQTYK